MTSRVDAHAVELQWDEDGLEMTLRTDDGGGDVIVGIIDPENLWRAVQEKVGPWHREMEHERRAFERAAGRGRVTRRDFYENGQFYSEERVLSEHDDPGHADHNLRADLHAMKEDA